MSKCPRPAGPCFGFSRKVWQWVLLHVWFAFVLCSSRFIKEHKDKNVKMVADFQDAILPKLAQNHIIREMGYSVSTLCGHHVFEFLFDAEKLIKCHTHALSTLHKQGINDYLTYQQNISEPFLNLIEDDWKALDKVRTSLVSNGAAMGNQSNDSTTLVGQPPCIHTKPIQHKPGHVAQPIIQTLKPSSVRLNSIILSNTPSSFLLM